MIDRFKPIAAVLLLVVAPTSADTERAELWNDCESMGLIADLRVDSTDIGLTEEAIEVAVRSRLRAARL